MNSSIFTLGVFAILICLSGCSSVQPPETEKSHAPSEEKVLNGPYELRLSVTPDRGKTDDEVTLTMEFRNTGTVTLLVPKSQDLQIDFRKEDPTGFERVTLLPPSECSGLAYARIEPGNNLTYNRRIKIPNMRGQIEIRVLSGKVPFVIFEPNSPQEGSSPLR